ncbi:MAG: leucine-rich repeat domain-containing protein [Clostridia bacterium]|nr:leucine-rich repeat domain-containing protein [Clostridia bacterium]
MASKIDILDEDSKKIGEIREDGTFEICEGVTVFNVNKKLRQNNFLIKKIVMPDSLLELGEDAFFACGNLEEVVFSKNLQIIKGGCFTRCSNLKELKLPHSLIRIEKCAFDRCHNLENIEFSNNLSEIGDDAFWLCTKLKKVELPESVVNLGKGAFQNCDKLEAVYLPKNLKSIGRFAFADCHRLRRVILPENLIEINAPIFGGCNNIQRIDSTKNFASLDEFNVNGDLVEIVLPDNLKRLENLQKNIDNATFSYKTYVHINEIKNCKVKFNDREIDVKGSQVFNGVLYKFLIKDENNMLYFPDNDGNCIEISEGELFKGANDRNKIASINGEFYYNLYLFNKYKHVPHKAIVINLPIDCIDSFYKNNNAKNLQEILKHAKTQKKHNLKSLLIISKALGVFSDNGAESKKATEFIINEILSKYDENKIHSLFAGFDEKVKYNNEFAKFFMTYFKDDPDFMVYKDDNGLEKNYLSASFNNFAKIQQKYPLKKVITRQNTERLTPQIVKKVLMQTAYENVDERAKGLAEVVSGYGYSQELYNKMEKWYLKGLSLQEQILKADIDVLLDSAENEIGENAVTYELLSKANPLSAVLGDITNCCQILDGAGESCLEYGMTMPNSSFLVFRYKEKLIAQAWVWYDEKTKQVTLDNIEVPNKIIREIENNAHLQQEFINCLFRFNDAVKNAMNKQAVLVEKVTIGVGYNDINKLLRKNFSLVDKPKRLSMYNGYTDASEQYEIIERFKKQPCLNEVNQREM